MASAFAMPRLLDAAHYGTSGVSNWTVSRFPSRWDSSAPVSQGRFMSLPVAVKLELVADYLVDMWEPAGNSNHRATLQTIATDLTAEFGICDQALLVSVCYLHRLKSVFDRNGIFTQDCSAQLFAVALLDACKFLYDVPPMNSDWADVAHFDRRRVNEMERELLDAFDFNLNVDAGEVAAVEASLADHGRVGRDIIDPMLDATLAYASPPPSGRASPYYGALHAENPPWWAGGSLDSLWADPADPAGCYGAYVGHGAADQLRLASAGDSGFSLFHHALPGPVSQLAPSMWPPACRGPEFGYPMSQGRYLMPEGAYPISEGYGYASPPPYAGHFAMPKDGVRFHPAMFGNDTSYFSSSTF